MCGTCIPWTMHTWMQTVGTTHAMRLDAITDQLLQDFTHLWCDDCSTHFIDQCLPLLFTIFRHQKVFTEFTEYSSIPILILTSLAYNSTTRGQPYCWPT